MKIVCLKGGLGNQMFEYCRYMEMKAGGHDVRLYYDRSWTAASSLASRRKACPRWLPCWR